MSLGSMKFEVNSDTGFVTVGYGAGSSPTFTRVLVGNGTAAAPSYSFTNFNTTGFYIIDSQNLAITFGGTQKFQINNAGEIYGPALAARLGLLSTGAIELASSGGAGVKVSVVGAGKFQVTNASGAGTDVTLSILQSGVVDWYIANKATSGALAFGNGSGEWARITSSGNILVGTTTDNTLGKIQVSGSITAAEAFGTGLFGYFGGSSLVLGTLNATTVVLRTNNIAAMTIDTSQNVTFSKDLYLGTSGPSVPSSLNARNSRQGLSFNGTSGATISVPAFGTNNYTYAAWIKVTEFASGNRHIFDGSNAPTIYVGTSGQVAVYDRQGSAAKATTGGGVIALNRWYHVAYSRALGQIYVNGTPIGSVVSDTSNYTGGLTTFGKDNGIIYFNGVIAGGLVYNRSLTAAELLALYEAGAPEQADFALATNDSSATVYAGQQIINGANSTFASGTGWTLEVGNTISGGKLNLANLAYALCNNTNLRKNCRYRLTITIDSISAGSLRVYDGVNYTGNIGSTTGTKTIEYTMAGDAPVFIRMEGGTAVVDDITITPLGVILAPDANQAGSGLSWYDTSGNNRTVTLPSTGVSWNVPTSGYYTTTGALNITGGANLILTASTGNLYLRSTTGGAIFDTGAYFLFGTATNSSNGIIQLATHTTIAGGIGFGTDLAIFRSGIGTFHFQTTAGNIGILLGDTGYTMQLGSRLVSSNGELTVQTSNANSLFLKTGGVTALTIDSSLNSTFAGTAITLASATAKAGLRLPHGAAPTAPVNGDIWTTTAGLYVRINGVTVGPLT